MKLSIIIPMYNCEKYIAACLDSILRSDLPRDRYEILVINDGSRDRGPEIAQRYAAEHCNITYLTQENQGQSVARNYGIRECHGEYVWCVDGDDKVDARLQPLMPYLNRNLDIIFNWMKVVTESGTALPVRDNSNGLKIDTVYKGRDIILNGNPLGSVCNLVIKKDFILQYKLFFKEGIAQQDVELSYRMFSYASRVVFTEITPYVYIKHPNSTSMSINPKKKQKYVKDSIIVMESKRNLARELRGSDPELSHTLKVLSDNSLFGLVYMLFRKKKELKPLGVNKAVLDVLIDKGLYPLKGDFHSFKKNVFIHFLNIRSVVS